jgi:Reverse transcriptase (RNA-dependent DNA polymerase).
MPTRVQGTDTIFFIPKHKIPPGRKVTYARIVPAIRPQKDETHRTRMTVGGNLLQYDQDTGSPAADLVTAKLFFNSVISTPRARFMNMDVKDFYLNNIMPRYEYMKIHISLLPKDVINHYHLQHIQDEHGYVYMEIRKGMYGLKQAGRIAYDALVKHLAKYGYVPSNTTQGLWTHVTRPIQFILVVDDFGVKYTNEADVHHLIAALKDKYNISIDWEGSLYCGLHLKWDYTAGYVDVSMPQYIATALKKFNHPPPQRPQHAPAKWTRPTFGAKIQYAHNDESPHCSPQEKLRIQQITGTLLYYARAVDPTMLVALNDISHEQANPTTTTQTKITQLLDYAATYPEATIRYYKSDMILWIDSDAAYLVAPQARSRVGGHFKLSSKPQNPLQNPPNNGPVHVECTLLRQVVAAASEAELGATFINAQKAIPMRQALIDMGHPQPPTPIKTDNSTAHGILTSLVKQKRPKAFDMRFYWLKDRIAQQQFQVYWKPGKQNLADYVTKHHLPTHHRIMRPKYLLNLVKSVALMRGCVTPFPATARDQRSQCINTIVKQAIQNNHECKHQFTQQISNLIS